MREMQRLSVATWDDGSLPCVLDSSGGGGLCSDDGHCGDGTKKGLTCRCASGVILQYPYRIFLWLWARACKSRWTFYSVAVSIAKERLGSRRVTEELCARLQMEMSLLSPAKDGQRWWAATGSQRRVWLAVLLVSGICFVHSLISALPPRSCGSGLWAPPVCDAFFRHRQQCWCKRLLFTSPELRWGQGEVLEASFHVLLGLMGVPSRWLLRWWPPGTNASSAQKSTPLVVSSSFPFLLDRLS